MLFVALLELNALVLNCLLFLSKSKLVSADNIMLEFLRESWMPIELESTVMKSRGMFIEVPLELMLKRGELPT